MVLERLSRMVRLPNEFYPGLEDLDPREARRFAVAVLLAADKHRAIEFRAGLPSGQNPSADVAAAVATRMSAMSGL